MHQENQVTIRECNVMHQENQGINSGNVTLCIRKIREQSGNVTSMHQENQGTIRELYHQFPVETLLQ